MQRSWLLAVNANVIIGLLGMATASLIARTLGPADRGVFAAASIVSGFLFSAVGVPGLQAVVFCWSRAGTKKTRGEVVGAAITLIALSSGLLVPCAIVANHFFLRGLDNADAFRAANIYLISLPLTLISGGIGGAFLVTGASTTFWAIRVGGALAYLVLVAGLAITKSVSVVSLMVAVCVSLLLPVLWGLKRFGEEFSVAPSIERSAIAKMAAFSFKANAVGLPSQLNLRLDQAVMAVVLPASVLGQYAVAYAWSSSVMMVGGGLTTVLLARSSGILQNSDTEQVGILFGQFRLVVVAVSLLGAAVALSTPIMIPLLFGTQFTPAVIPGILLCCASVLVVATLSLHEIARGLSHPGTGLPSEIVALAVGFVLLLLLIRPFGGIGAAVAAICCYATALAGLAIRLDKRLGGKLLPLLLPRSADATALISWLRNGGKPVVSSPDLTPR